MRLTKKQQAALDYFGLVFAKSDEPGAGWFAYEDDPYNLPSEAKYPGSSCECMESIVGWYEDAMKMKGGRDESSAIRERQNICLRMRF